MVSLNGGYMKCAKCGYWASFAKPGAGAEVAGLDATRERNFRAICAGLKNNFPHCETLLDVGCSRGLFLRIAGGEGFRVTGLEPDPTLAAEARAQGFEVLNGFFPEAKELEGRRFDAVVFNDSFEHMPNLRQVIGGIKTHLTPGGAAVVNLPSSDGLMFTLASFLNNCGVSGPFDRLWQKGFASPHLH
jgi:SAM-dependent methyltransferase